MNIATSQCISYNNTLISKQSKENCKSNNNVDCYSDLFIKNRPNSKQVSFSGLFNVISELLGLREPKAIDERDPSISFEQRLSIGLNNYCELSLSPEYFSGILSADKLKDYIDSVKKENFIASKKHQKDGIYNIDLNCVTNFSYNGNESIYDILDEAVKYANYHYKKTGENFVFAITDNETTTGVKHAIKIIVENPEKYTHLMFVPGVKVSFAYRTDDKNYSNNRLLVYGINPFSKNVDDFIENTLSKRENIVYEFIKTAIKLYKDAHFNDEFLIDDYNLNSLQYAGQTNVYSNLKKYIRTKSDEEILGLRMTPQEIFAFSENIFSSMDIKYKGSDEFINLCKKILNSRYESNFLIEDIYDKYSTRYDPKKNEIIIASDNIFSDFINCMKNEPHKPIMALEAPYYLTKNLEAPGAKVFPNVIDFIKNLQKYSFGMLYGFESLAPLYDEDEELNENEDIIQNFNSYIQENTNLKEVGGSFNKRDML